MHFTQLSHNRLGRVLEVTMNRKKIVRNHFLLGRGLSRITVAFAFTIIYMCGSLLLGTSTAYAGVPGGQVTDSVVQGVDIAKPAIVRIIGTITGRITVDFTPAPGVPRSATFPQGGDGYKLLYTGSGAFITAHGDILTADHLVHPPPDSLYAIAAQDIADFYNARSPNQFVTANDVLALLVNGIWQSQPQYDTPKMRAYLSTDYTGTTNATSLNAMPPSTYADVDKIEKTGDFEHGDTAILHIPMDDTPSIKLGDSTNVEPQDQLTILGFPGNGDILTANAKTLADTANPSTGFLTTSINKIFVSALKQTPAGAPLIQVGGNVEHGDSGGPALDDNGNIVGIVSFGGTDIPSGTSFLQANQTAKQFINDLQLNTQPGTFQSNWSQAFGQYSSTEAGHWHRAQQQLQQLQNNYPNFHAVQAFVDYATVQANKEATNPLSPSNLPLVIGIGGLILVVTLAFFFLIRRKPKPQAASATQAVPYQPSYSGAKPALESEQFFPSGSMARVDAIDLDGNRTPNVQLEQYRTMHAMPQAPQTPTPVAQTAQATPMASYNAAQSGQPPVAPNQGPMNPWPQPARYESAPPYGQPFSYGQQPYNPAQQSRPAQGNPAYPAQQQQYAPYSQPAAMPWPPIPANTSQPPAGASYAPQNPVQQDATMRRAQQSPVYGTPYGQPPQGYGAGPAQPRQASRPPMWDAAMSSDPPTVRSSQQGASASENIIKPGEKKKNTSSSIPALSQNETEIANTFSEQNAPTRFGEQ
jgi:hypothetical protein